VFEPQHHLTRFAPEAMYFYCLDSRPNLPSQTKIAFCRRLLPFIQYLDIPTYTSIYLLIHAHNYIYLYIPAHTCYYRTIHEYTYSYIQILLHTCTYPTPPTWNRHILATRTPFDTSQRADVITICLQLIVLVGGTWSAFATT